MLLHDYIHILVSKGFWEEIVKPGLVTIFPEFSSSSHRGTLWAGPHFGVAFIKTRNF